MDRGPISAVVSVGTVSLIALSTCTAIAADGIKPKRDTASHARPYAVFELAATERGRSRIALRPAGGEERPRMALILGTGF